MLTKLINLIFFMPKLDSSGIRGHYDSVGFWGATEELLPDLSLERCDLPKGAPTDRKVTNGFGTFNLQPFN